MTQSLLDSLPAQLDSLTVNKKTLNSLPQEILKEVFCNIDSQDLYCLKIVCSYWNNIIQELLDIQQLEVSKERLEDAVNIVDVWKKRSNGRYQFTIRRVPYSIKNIINKAVIGNLTGDYMYALGEITWLETLEELESNARKGGAYCGGSKDVPGSVWRTVLAMTELQYSVEELRDKSFTDKVVQSSMSKYKWYRFQSDYMMNIAWDLGLIALYPDNKTFSILLATDHD